METNMSNQILISTLFKIYKSERLPSDATIKNYISLLRIYKRDLGVNNISVSHQQLITWRDNILKRASITTWNSYFAQMKAIYEVAVEFNYLSENPFKKLKSISTHTFRPKTIEKITLNELLSLCDSIDNGWFWRIVINFYYYTGIRRSSLVGIKWSNISFNNKTLQITADNSKTNRELLLPIRDNEIQDLIHLKNKSLAIKPDMVEDDQVFNITLFADNFLGEKMTADNVSSFFKRASKALSTPISAHRLRHTMATNIANHPNCNLKALQNILGHTNLSTTLSYVHPKLEDMQRMQAIL